MISTTILTALEKKGDNIEESFAGVICDSTSVNINALKIVVLTRAPVSYGFKMV